MSRPHYLPEQAEFQSLLVASGLAYVENRGGGRVPLEKRRPTKGFVAPSQSVPVAPKTVKSPEKVPERPAVPAQETQPEPPKAPPVPPAPPKRNTLPSLTGKYLEERMNQFLGWILNITNAPAAFIADGQGLALGNINSDEHYIGVSPLVEAWCRDLNRILKRPVENAVLIPVEPSLFLQLIGVSISKDRFTLGIMLPKALSRKFITRLRGILTHILEEETS